MWEATRIVGIADDLAAGVDAGCRTLIPSREGTEVAHHALLPEKCVAVEIRSITNHLALGVDSPSFAKLGSARERAQVGRHAVIP